MPPGGSSTVHIYTQTIHRTTQNKQYIEQHKLAVPRLNDIYVNSQTLHSRRNILSFFWGGGAKWGRRQSLSVCSLIYLMTHCELYKTERKSSRFLYSNAALFAFKTIYRRLAKLQTKQLGRNGTPSAIIKVYNHYTKMFCFEERGLFPYVESEEKLSTADNNLTLTKLWKLTLCLMVIRKLHCWKFTNSKMW